MGYLKPIFKAAFLATTLARYDTTLTIGEDYNFLLMLLRRGAKFRVYPLLLYFYRKHVGSASHRLHVDALHALKISELAN